VTLTGGDPPTRRKIEIIIVPRVSKKILVDGAASQ
jgi:hypothetical protein